MPQKNTLKDYSSDSYYHVYSRGTNKQKVFLEADDYNYFCSLFARYLSIKAAISKTGVAYPNFSKSAKLLTYCLMPNHFHMLIYQAEDAETLRRLMSSLLTSYSKYFNLKYKRYGSIFESRYKAKRIDNDSYLAHISRYIHMNPRRWETYRQSSLKYIIAGTYPDWLQSQEVLTDFKSKYEYLAFLRDYQENKDSLELTKLQLANN